MRTTPRSPSVLALLCTLALLAGCERRADRAELDRPEVDSPAARAVADTAGSALDWRPAPPALPPGPRAAVLSGDPTKAGPYTLRLDMPAGYQVPPHHHPMSEHVRVLEGQMMLGRGKTWDDDKLEALAVGAEVTVAAQQPHFVQAKERSLIEVRSTGPFQITYENPADDPRKKPVQ